MNITLDFTAFLALRSRFFSCHFLLFRIVSGTAGSLPSTATLASENHTDDIRIVGDDDEVKTGLQNRSGIPDAMTKASINCHNGCNFYPLRFAISGV